MLIFLFFSENVFSQTRIWVIAVAGGIVGNIKSPLKIYQHNQPTLAIKARYKTEPLHSPIYYDIRIATWQDRGWALKFTHHKIILQNRPDEVQRVSIIDGFNLLTLNRPLVI